MGVVLRTYTKRLVIIKNIFDLISAFDLKVTPNLWKIRKKNDPLYLMIIQEQWEMLERRAKERSRRLEDAVGMQLFNNGVRGVLEWAASTLANMEGHDPVRLELSIYLYNRLYIYLYIFLFIYLSIHPYIHWKCP